MENQNDDIKPAETNYEHVNNELENGTSENNIEIGDCHYSTNTLIDRCSKFGKYHVKMNGKKSKPKNRIVCDNCYHFLMNNNLATVMFN